MPLLRIKSRHTTRELHRARLDQATQVLTGAGFEHDKATAFVTAMALAAAPNVSAAALPYGAVPNRAAVEVEEERDAAEARSERAFGLFQTAFWGALVLLTAIMLTAILSKAGTRGALQDARLVSAPAPVAAVPSVIAADPAAPGTDAAPDADTVTGPSGGDEASQ